MCIGSPTVPIIPAGAVVVVYDGDCALCRRGIDEIRRRDRQALIVCLPRRTPGIEEIIPGLSHGDFNSGIRVVDPDGTIHVGADGIRRIASQLPVWRRFTWVYDVPLIRGLARRIYAWVAANRMRLSRQICPSQGCELVRSSEAPGAGGPRETG